MFDKIPYDKKLHFAAGFIVTVVVGISLFWFAVNSFVMIGIGTGFLAGIAKEIYDEYDYGGFDWKDMIATWIGALVGGIMLAICCI